MDSIIYVVGKDDDNRTISGILKERYSLSRSLLRRIKREGETLLNGIPVFMNQRVSEGDMLAIKLDFAGQSRIVPDNDLPDIIYEDENILIVNKPAGKLVHPVGKERLGTLANSVMGHWLKSGKTNPVFRPVFRIDRDTSGLVLVSGSHLAHLNLVRQIREKTMKRTYIAVAEGKVSTPQGVINAPIARRPGSFIEREVSPTGRSAVTRYRVIEYLPGINATVLEVNLETGRTHQIRVHMSHLGYPLLGDSLYGGSCDYIRRQALHSFRLAFFNPLTGAKMEFRCSPPEDMRELVGNISWN
ncbi:MAG: RluA family pseudouridine synthase [Bacillota bacterium]